ncbi:MAG TPA: 3-isopropylmalate dehydratase small subunit [Miltoncostaeales bacterium]|nr:3-isopropylmalate dehydratase small subunit [Miltoncostaeales bacterium]
MNPFTVVTGAMAPLDRADVDTDQIIPKQFLKRIERTGFGEFLFCDWRGSEGFLLEDPAYRDAPILVTGRNFGCGSSREHAPWALEDFGYRAIIAPSYADIFRSNCTKIGLLPVVLTEDQVQKLIDAALATPGVSATVDLERQVVVAPDGEEMPFEIDASVRYRLMNGLDDIGITMSNGADIDAYEHDREREGPVTTAL